MIDLHVNVSKIKTFKIFELDIFLKVLQVYNCQRLQF